MNLEKQAYLNEQQYLTALRTLVNSMHKDDRTGTGTQAIFGRIESEYTLGDRANKLIPLLSTKKVFYHAIIHELIWMLSGSSRLKYLKDNKVNIWDEWVLPGTEVFGGHLSISQRLALAKKRGLDIEGRTNDCVSTVVWLNDNNIPQAELLDGDLGPVYGKQWRFWEDVRIVPKDHCELELLDRGFKLVDSSPTNNILRREVDQIAEIEKALKNNPNSRRIILSGWNVARIDEMALPPCHTLAQWGVEIIEGRRTLSCKLYQRSADWLLGVPFNITFYSIMTHLLADIFYMEPGSLFHTVGDAHIYKNHAAAIEEQLSRTVIEDNVPLISFPKYESILDVTAEEVVLSGYKHHSAISAPVAV